MSDTTADDKSNEKLGMLHMTCLPLIATAVLGIACWAGLT